MNGDDGMQSCEATDLAGKISSDNDSSENPPVETMPTELNPEAKEVNCNAEPFVNASNEETAVMKSGEDSVDSQELSKSEISTQEGDDSASCDGPPMEDSDGQSASNPAAVTQTREEIKELVSQRVEYFFSR